MAKLYIAFGSNLSKRQMRQRCPTARPLGKFMLTEARLVFRGVADLEYAPGETVPCGLWSLYASDERALDGYEGVRVSKLLDLVGATGTTVTALALNDYKTDIPLDDFRKYPALMATKRDGAYMPVKDKGPLFIVYPYDSDPELKHQRFYSRSAWQVARMVLK